MFYLQIAFPILAVLISAGAFLVSLWSYRTSIQPVLVLTRMSEELDDWHVENVGRGPALRVRILDVNNEGKCVSNVCYYPIAVGAKVRLVAITAASALASPWSLRPGLRMRARPSGAAKRARPRGRIA